MALRKKKRNSDLFDEADKLEDAFKQALAVTPKPPGNDIVPRKRTSNPLEVHARYKLIKKRVRKRLASRYIEDEIGQRKYIAGGIYAVAGQYKVRGDLLDWDHELRSIDSKLDDKVRLKLILHMAKRLKVRM